MCICLDYGLSVVLYFCNDMPLIGFVHTFLIVRAKYLLVILTRAELTLKRTYTALLAVLLLFLVT